MLLLFSINFLSPQSNTIPIIPNQTFCPQDGTRVRGEERDPAHLQELDAAARREGRHGAERAEARGQVCKWNEQVVSKSGEFVSALAYRFCLAVPAAFTQPGTTF